MQSSKEYTFYIQDIEVNYSHNLAVQLTEAEWG